jgi:hypothetical protein
VTRERNGQVLGQRKVDDKSNDLATRTELSRRKIRFHSPIVPITEPDISSLVHFSGRPLP